MPYLCMCACCSSPSCPGRNLVYNPMASPSLRHTPCAFLGQAEKAAAEKAAAEKAAALRLLQPLEALSLDADTLRRATAAAVAYCDAQGAASVADLVERASRLIAPQQAVSSYRLGIWSSWPWAVALRCPHMLWRLCCVKANSTNHTGSTCSTGLWQRSL